MKEPKLIEVKLEIVRPGPLHNQLLSPLTQYLALCGDGGPVTVQMGLEHKELLNRLERLRYFYVDRKTGRAIMRDDRVREAEVDEFGRLIGKILGEIRTLGPELNALNTENGQGVHLRMVLSGSELALIPFEMAISPLGFPGQRLPLLLQQKLPITLTREVRRGQPLPLDWDRAPRILFVAAAPGGMSVPTDDHYRVIRSALEPWVRWAPSSEERLKHLKELMTFLPNATLRAVREACVSNSFTHVHILAHGNNYEKAGEKRWGLAFCSEESDSEIDTVSGERLAQALRATRPNCGTCSRPSLVTLMTCDSANQASVVSPGGSIAYDLHAFGIPWVIASQFPLTVKGSVEIARLLYPALLGGDDPRCVVRTLRNFLRASTDSNHDWASLVIYATYSSSLGQQVVRFRDRQLRKAINISFDRANLSSDEDEVKTALEAIDKRFDEWEERLSPEDRKEIAEFYGMKGAMKKRVALIKPAKGEEDAVNEMLEEALSYYRTATKIQMANHWTTTQCLSLSAVLGKSPESDWYVLARQSAGFDLQSSHPETVAWAHSSLAELEMLEVTREDYPDIDSLKDKTCKHCESIVRIMGEESFPVYATRRQFERYLTYWKDPRWEEIAKAAVEALSPSGPSDRYRLPPDRR